MRRSVLTLAPAFLILSITPAFAYIDPNAGGLILQLLTPLLVAVTVAFGTLRRLAGRLLGRVKAHGGEIRAIFGQQGAQTRRGLLALWKTLILVAMVVMALQCLSYLLVKMDGWLVFLTPWDVVISAGRQILLALAEGAVLGTLLFAVALALLPALSLFGTHARARLVTRVALVGGAALCALLLLEIAVKWIASVDLPRPPPLVVWLARAAIAAGFCFALWGTAWREKSFQAMEGFFLSRTTRRTLLATGGVAALLSLVGIRIRGAAAAPVPPRRGAPNILLITFDTLSAEDMSVYGYRRPTTPNLEAFARTATRFTGYYASSTFTTPCVTTMLTGRYPSRTHVYQLEGALADDDRRQTVFSLLREAGYAIAAAVDNPYAHPWQLGIDEPALVALPPSQRHNALSGALAGAGDTVFMEYAMSQEDLALRACERFTPLYSDFPPARTLTNARKLLGELPGDRPHFLWAHSMAPHGPYQAEPPFLHRFLAGDAMRTKAEMDFASGRRLTPEDQPLLEMARARYDEFVLESDAAFGDFLRGLEDDGRLDNTIIIVSADHGESFGGGIYTHASPEPVRPVIHIPLLVRMPGQAGPATSAAIADQTSLTPTILDMAGVAAPNWMQGRSLLRTLKGEPAAPQLAFCQYLAQNSVFGPIRNGTASVIDGTHQFVLNIATGRGMLRPLSEANLADADHSKENPALAAALRRAIHARFPELPRRDA